MLSKRIIIELMFGALRPFQHGYFIIIYLDWRQLIFWQYIKLILKKWLVHATHTPASRRHSCFLGGTYGTLQWSNCRCPLQGVKQSIVIFTVIGHVFTMEVRLSFDEPFSSSSLSFLSPDLKIYTSPFKN